MLGIGRKAWLLALASGVLQALAFPSPALDWLCWLALAPLLLALLEPQRAAGVQLRGAQSHTPRPLRLRDGFLLGYASGILWYAATCFWVYQVMHQYGGLNAAASLGMLTLFNLYLGLYHGLFGWLLVWTARGPNGTRRALLLAPFLWVAVELARAQITSFPWDLLGTAQVNNTPLTRVAQYAGVYGVSFEIALINTAFAAAFLLPRRRRMLLGAALVAAVLLQCGELVQFAPLPAPHLARLVQQNIPVLEPGDWTAEYFDRTLGDLARISATAAQQAPGTTEKSEASPGLIVWPESPAPFFANDPRFRAAVSEVAHRAGAYVVAGNLGVGERSPQQAGTGLSGGPAVFNSASLITPGGVWSARYDKIHLVPFGEYVPFKSLFSFAEKLTREVGEFARGSERAPLEAGPYKLGVFICYESIFPDEIRQFAAHGAQVFVNISNDGWYGHSGNPGQHLNMARMRAIENRRWLLRATNTGITASIDPYGRVVAQAPRDQRVALPAPFGLIAEQTFYTRHGDWFAYGCVIIWLLGSLVRVRTGSSG